MPDEEKVVEQGAQPEGQSTAQPPVEDVASLKSQLAELQKRAEAAEREAKAHQSNFTKTQQELRRQQALDQKIDALAAKLEVLAEFTAVKKQGDMDEDTSSTPQPDIKKRMADAETRVSQAKVSELAYQADREAFRAGIEIQSDPALEDARRLFRSGKPEEGLDEVRRIIASRSNPPAQTAETTKKPETDGKITPEQEAEIARKWMEKNRPELLKTDTGTPSGQLKTWEDVKAAYANGSLNFAQFSAEKKKRGIS